MAKTGHQVNRSFSPSFKWYRKDRAGRHGGGVFLLISSEYEREEPEELQVDKDCDLVWTRVKVRGTKDLYIGSCYRPPDKHDKEYLEHLQSYLSRIKIPTHNGAHLWLGGDFNLADIDWKE